jgi:hypothetical protein
MASIKDQARYFAHPTLFFQKMLDEVEQLNFGNINRILQKLSLQPIQFNWQYGSPSEVTINDIYDRISSLREALRQLWDMLCPHSYECSSTPKVINVPTHKQYIYKEMRYYLLDCCILAFPAQM